MAKCLVLFDLDGCTAVIPTVKVDIDARIGERYNYMFKGKMHLVEVLAINDSVHDLDQFERSWQSSARASVVTMRKEVSDEIFGGFLDCQVLTQMQTQLQMPIIRLRKADVIPKDKGGLVGKENIARKKTSPASRVKKIVSRCAKAITTKIKSLPNGKRKKYSLTQDVSTEKDTVTKPVLKRKTQVECSSNTNKKRLSLTQDVSTEKDTVTKPVRKRKTQVECSSNTNKKRLSLIQEVSTDKDTVTKPVLKRKTQVECSSNTNKKRLSLKQDIKEKQGTVTKPVAKRKSVVNCSNASKKRLGSNGRTITVEFSGAMETGEGCEPARNTMFMDHLTEDQQETINRQVQMWGEKMVCTGTQTEPVLVIAEDDDIKDFEKNRKWCQILTMVTELHKKFINEASQQKTSQNVKAVKLTVESPNRDDDNTSFAPLDFSCGTENQQITTSGSKNQNKDTFVKDPHNGHQKTNNVNENTKQFQVIPMDLTCHRQSKNAPTEYIQTFSDVIQENETQTQDKQYENDPKDMVQNLTVYMPQLPLPHCSGNMLTEISPKQNEYSNSNTVNSQQTTAAPTVDTQFFAEVIEAHDIDVNVDVQQANQYDFLADNYVATPLYHGHQETTITRPPLMPVTYFTQNAVMEVKSHQDILGVSGNVTLKLAREVKHELLLKYGHSASNFAWKLAQCLFTEDELVSKNFNGRGRPSLSPRRKMIVQDTVREFFGTDPNSNKAAVDGINSGIRSIRRRKLQKLSSSL